MRATVLDVVSVAAKTSVLNRHRSEYQRDGQT